MRDNFKVLSTSFLFRIEWKENAEITQVRSIEEWISLILFLFNRGHSCPGYLVTAHE